VSWGGEDRGWPVLGLGKTNLAANLVRIGSETNWIFVSAGDAHNLALKSDGTIWAWGANYRGQLGDGNSGMKLTNSTPNIRDHPFTRLRATTGRKCRPGLSPATPQARRFALGVGT